jgi:hypothetical protein
VKTNDRPKLTLGYSSPAAERERERQDEDDRRKALGDYNESTFGERHPVRNGLLLLFVYFVIVVPLAMILPRGAESLLVVFGLMAGATLLSWWLQRG